MHPPSHHERKVVDLSIAEPMSVAARAAAKNVLASIGALQRRTRVRLILRALEGRKRGKPNWVTVERVRIGWKRESTLVPVLPAAALCWIDLDQADEREGCRIPVGRAAQCVHQRRPSKGNGPKMAAPCQNEQSKRGDVDPAAEIVAARSIVPQCRRTALPWLG